MLNNPESKLVRNLVYGGPILSRLLFLQLLKSQLHSLREVWLVVLCIKVFQEHFWLFNRHHLLQTIKSNEKLKYKYLIKKKLQHLIQFYSKNGICNSIMDWQHKILNFIKETLHRKITPCTCIEWYEICSFKEDVTGQLTQAGNWIKLR